MSNLELLRKIADTLDRWAVESQVGGWSTHQVKPMQELSNEIKVHIYHQKETV